EAALADGAVKSAFEFAVEVVRLKIAGKFHSRFESFFGDRRFVLLLFLGRSRGQEQSQNAADGKSHGWCPLENRRNEGAPFENDAELTRSQWQGLRVNLRKDQKVKS